MLNMNMDGRPQSMVQALAVLGLHRYSRQNATTTLQKHAQIDFISQRLYFVGEKGRESYPVDRWKSWVREKCIVCIYGEGTPFVRP